VIGHGVPGLNIRQEYLFDASAMALFEALTGQVDRWWPASARLLGPNSRLTLPAVLGADFTESAGPSGAIWGRIDMLETGRRLYLQGWFGVRGVVAGRVYFDLEPEGAGTRLVLLHQAIGPVTEDQSSRFRALWRDILDQALRQHLTGIAV